MPLLEFHWLTKDITFKNFCGKHFDFKTIVIIILKQDYFERFGEIHWDLLSLNQLSENKESALYTSLCYVAR